MPWRRRMVMAAVVLLALTACGSGGMSPVLINLQDKAYPTGIDYPAKRRQLVFSDYAGAVYSMHEDGWRVAKLLNVHAHDCARSLRVRVDDARNRLWVLSAAGICVFDLQSLRLVRHLPLGDISEYRLASELSDIALDAAGNAYVIEAAIDPVVYRFDTDGFAVTVSGGKGSPRGPAVYTPRGHPLNAITVTPDGKRVLYVDAYARALFAMDLATRLRTLVAMPHHLYAVNGLAATPRALSMEGIDLYVLSAGNSVVSVVSMDGDFKSAHIRVQAARHLDQPLSATWVHGTLWVTNSQILRHPDMNGDTVTPRAFTLARLDQAYFAGQAGNPITDRVLAP